MKWVTRMRLWVSAAIIGVVVLIAFALSVPHTTDLKVEKKLVETPAIPVVVVKDVFKKGVHTISGSLVVPNACTPVSASATLTGDASSTQSILLTLVSETASGICLQIPTKAPFQTTLTAPARLPLHVTANGVTASTTSP